MNPMSSVKSPAVVDVKSVGWWLVIVKRQAGASNNVGSRQAPHPIWYLDKQRALVPHSSGKCVGSSDNRRSRRAQSPSLSALVLPRAFVSQRWSCHAPSSVSVGESGARGVLSARFCGQRAPGGGCRAPKSCACARPVAQRARPPRV